MPAEPLAQCWQRIASSPRAATNSLIALISASVSEWKWLIATTAGTPNCLTFSIWRPRLAQPFFTASTFSLPRSSFLTPPCIFMARTVATMTAAAGLSPALRHLMSKNFSAPEVGAEAGFGHHIVGQLQRRRGRHHRVAAMRDVGERAAMHEGRIVLQRLHQVRLHGVLQQHRHGAVGLDVAGIAPASCRAGRR